MKNNTKQMKKKKNKNAKVTDEIREQMFKIFCESKSVHYVAKACKVSPTTATKYMKIDKWKEREQTVRQRMQKKTETNIVNRRREWVKKAQALQNIGTRKYFNKDGSPNETVIKAQTPRDATHNIEVGIDIERKALHEPERVNVSFDKLEDMTIEQLEALKSDLTTQEENGE